MLGQIQYLLNQNNINILNKEFTSNVTLSLEATSEEFDNIKTLFPLGINF
jgi:putative IMPACT (imprinted ancient) family translation regulator